MFHISAIVRKAVGIERCGPMRTSTEFNINNTTDILDGE